ncbi:uncharacterized protein LOC8286095 [Ricinus communis]|uniref:uncharacterized protein LOC8286095 n=1 Tax=Ricinus communis TaxID=3988 RepID=UPI00201A3B45|nr:uncharacterized protein LOC8286095 [Ricinus communis]
MSSTCRLQAFLFNSQGSHVKFSVRVQIPLCYVVSVEKDGGDSRGQQDLSPRVLLMLPGCQTARIAEHVSVSGAMLGIIQGSSPRGSFIRWNSERLDLFFYLFISFYFFLLFKAAVVEGINSGMVTKEEGIELELGLSIGGSYRRENGNVLKSGTSMDMGSSEKSGTCIRSSSSPCFGEDAMQELDPKTKREMHALRRKEAKRRKELKKGFCKGYNLNSSQLNNHGEIKINKNNGMWLKAKDFQVSNSDGPECKKIKMEATGSDQNDTSKVNLNLSMDHDDPNGNNNNSAYLPLHYGLPANGFVYPCGNMNVMPCWFTAIAEEGNAVPVFSYGFVPFQAGSNPGHHFGNGYESEHNCSLDGGGNRKVGSNGSPLGTSSTGSDHRSSSHEGGGSSLSRSHSSPSVPEQSQLSGLKANKTRGHSELGATSYLAEPGSVNESTNQVDKLIQSNSNQPSSVAPKEEAKIETEPDPAENHVTTPENPIFIPLMEAKGNMGKPPKPQSENHITPSLPYMPCVSTTGNGPNGKTINGFLHRYTKTEVSIICVCHGSSFSPAEFVQHAGGTDVSHPLRHITVIPSAI